MRARLGVAARWAFLIAAAAFIWWGLRDRGGDILDALRRTDPWAVVLGAVLVTLGILLTGISWLRILAEMGHPLERLPGLRVFFLGQLGKYIPGSVWSFGAQAALARDFEVPARETVAASMVFLGFSVATSTFGGMTLFAVGAATSSVPIWVSAAVALLALLGMHPAVVGWLTRRIVKVDVVLSWRAWGVVQGWIWGAWALYAIATWLVVPGGLALLTAAMLLSYAGGVVVLLAPAGLGAREGVFVAVAAGSIGLPAAAAGALVTRLFYLFGDVALAAVLGLLGRRRSGDRVS